MNNNIEKPEKTVIRMLRPMLGLLLFSVAIWGCMREQDTAGKGDEASILLTVNLPDAALPTRAVGREDNVADLRILVFERGQDGDYTFLYQSNAQEVSPSGNNQRFQAQLRATNDPLKLIVLANTSYLTDASYIPHAGDAEADVREAYVYTYPTAGLSDNPPMYGEYVLDDGLMAGNNSITIPVLRAIGRVDVTLNLDQTSGEFILDEVYAFRVNDSGRMIPDPVADISSPVVTVPSIPSGAQFLGDPISITVVGGTNAIEGLYIPESRAAATAADRLLGTTTIVVGGRFGGSNVTTYYRADLDPDGTGQAFGQVLRNHRYIFNITHVSSAGWDTPEEAAVNFNSSIIIDIQAWEDFTTDISYGIDHFNISARYLNLPYPSNRTRVIDIESQKDYTIQWLDASGNPTGDTQSSSEEGTISNGDFEVSVSLEPAAGDQTQLVFRTLRDNHAGTLPITHKLRITVGLSKIDITVSQDYSGMYSHRSFNVLTGYRNGSPFAYLGYTYIQNPTIGWDYYPAWAMRAILDAQFSPNGVIKIGGFAFDMISDATDYLGATTNTATIERIIRQQDVIFLTYQTAPSTQVAALLLNWLNADRHRVLIVAFDSMATNANLRDALLTGVTWYFPDTQGSFHFSSNSDADFLGGPFGTVNTPSPMSAFDSTYGYIYPDPASITPLIVRSDSDLAMVVGVDKARRIIYIGDVNLFQHTVEWLVETGPMSNDSGNVVNNLDRLMANMWAWVVEQLIYGY